MSETPLGPDGLDGVPEPSIKGRRHISIVWIIPLVAALAGLWMVYNAISSEGPTITIRFDTAEGLVAGKTKIKFKDVDVGQVEAVEFSQDLDHVVVQAKMIKGMERYLRSETLFWVVRARVTVGEISGLSTLFSGAYIGVQPTRRGRLQTEFEGLRRPPAVMDAEQGRQFVIRASRLGSLDVGSPVYYRQVRVGQVVSYDLRPDDQVDIRIFIQAPHQEKVRANTRFWNVSGVDVSLDARGVHVDTESMVSLLLGGMAFETPAGGEPQAQAESETVFSLYANREQSYARVYEHKEYYILRFDGSVRGLSIGAPVEFRGMTIGQVTDMKLRYDMDKRQADIPITVEIEPERFEFVNRTEDKTRIVETMVARGLRAQLKMGNMLTGRVYVDLDFHPDAPLAYVVRNGDLAELPTLPSPLEGIVNSLGRVLAKVEALPLGEMTGDARQTLDEMRAALEDSRALMRNVDRRLVPAAGEALDQARKTLAEVESALDPDSVVSADLQRLLKELADAARSLRALADYLERQPDALLYGKEGK